MKTKKTLIFSFALIICLILSACSPGNTPGEPVNQSDLNPNLTVTKDPADIKSFSNSSYEAANKEQAEQLIGMLGDMFSDPGNFFDSFLNISPNYRSSSARAINPESEIMYLSALSEPPYMIASGYVQYAATWDDENGFPFLLNGDTKFRVVFDEFFEEGLGIIGVIAGHGTANINAPSEDSISGTVIALYNLAVNLAFTDPDDESGKTLWAKCIASISVNSNLNSGKVTGSVNIELFGQGNASLAVDSFALDIDIEDLFELLDLFEDGFIII